MTISNLFQSDRVGSMLGAVQPALQRAQDDFTQQLQTALQAAIDSNAPSAREALQPALTQVTNSVESVFAQLRVNLASQSAATQATEPLGALAQAAGAQPAPGADAAPRDYLLPGEPGAGLPANYRKSPLYQDWLSQKPTHETSGANFSKDLVNWQKSNPYYIDPDNYASFDAYLEAVSISTASGNTAAATDQSRYSSFLTSYYGPAAVANPWGDRLGKIEPEQMIDWPEGAREQYETALAALHSTQALEAAGLLGKRG